MELDEKQRLDTWNRLLLTEILEIIWLASWPSLAYLCSCLCAHLSHTHLSQQSRSILQNCSPPTQAASELRTSQKGPRSLGYLKAPERKTGEPDDRKERGQAASLKSFLSNNFWARLTVNLNQEPLTFVIRAFCFISSSLAAEFTALELAEKFATPTLYLVARVYVFRARSLYMWSNSHLSSSCSRYCYATFSPLFAQTK